MNKKRCRRCILPETFPGISFDETGLCNICGQKLSGTKKKNINAAGLDEKLNLLRKRYDGKGEYDAVVAFSGGKDSAYTLIKMVKEYKMKCLAVTIDNGFIARQAIRNIKTITDALEVDSIIYRPNFVFIKKMFAESIRAKKTNPSIIKRSSILCAPCIDLINSYIIKTALMANVSIIACGFVDGQTPASSPLFKIKINMLTQFRKNLMEYYVNLLGDEAKKYFGISGRLFAAKGGDAILCFLNPMLGLAYNEDKIIKKISETGWEYPETTGAHSSNCLLNDAGIYIHNKRFGFNPYVNELARMVRGGSMSRKKAIEKDEKIIEYANIEQHLSVLGITGDDI